MTLLELISLDLKDVNKTLEADAELSSAFVEFLERVGFGLEGGRSMWLEIDHSLNCPNCKDKVTVH